MRYVALIEVVYLELLDNGDELLVEKNEPTLTMIFSDYVTGIRYVEEAIVQHTNTNPNSFCRTYASGTLRELPDDYTGNLYDITPMYRGECKRT